MTNEEWQTVLRGEGYKNIYAWKDKPSMIYGDHRHATDSTHVVLEGKMIVTIQGRKKLLQADERLNIPANTVHSVEIGEEGCTYVVGEMND